jgi:tetratricopeptide (TPR) repeat protein
LDGDKEEGIELAKTLDFSSYPTFVLMDEGGETLERWSGYAREEFLAILADGLTDPSTIAEKQARFAANPTPRDGEKLARYHSSRDEHGEAVALYRELEELDPAVDRSHDIFTTMVYGFGGGGFELADVQKAARRDAATANGEARRLLEIASYMGWVAGQVGEPTLVVPYLEPALAASAGSEDEWEKRMHDRLLIEKVALVDGDVEEAVRLKKKSLPEGWEQDPRALNSFSWWCFERRLDLEEAEALARKGVELAPDDATKAQILDTLAEILYVRGSADEALAMIEQAITAAPDREYYKKQRERFRQGAAGG